MIVRCIDWMLRRWNDYQQHKIEYDYDKDEKIEIASSETVSRVPSWHHQAVLSVEGTPLKVTAVTKTSGISIIEAVERTDKPFFIGLQYHPEVAVAKHANGAADASRFMDYEDALCYFRALVKQGEQIQ